MTSSDLYKLKIVTETVDPWAYTSRSLPSNETHRIQALLFYKGDEIGWVDAVQTRWGFYETHSNLEEEHQGLGFGTFMYRRVVDVCFRKGLDVRSSLRPSAAADRVWKSASLSQFYVVKRERKRWRIVGRV